MSFDINDDSIIDHIWFSAGTGNFDVLAMLWKPKPTEEWRLQWRFRYYDPETDESTESNWYEATCRSDAGEQELQKMRQSWKVISLMGGAGGFTAYTDEIDCRGLTSHQALEKMSSHSWCTVRKPTQKEIAEFASQERPS